MQVQATDLAKRLQDEWLRKLWGIGGKEERRAVSGVLKGLQPSRASLTVRITVKNGNPPGTGKIWENRFFTGKMDHHGAKCTQIGAQTCQGTSRTCQNFFTFTFKAAGVTFLKVILHLLQKVLNRQIWISLAVVSYLSPPVFPTTIPHHCCIVCHYMEVLGAKKREN